MTTYCDINTCEDCPRYGDDCDGDKRVEHTDLISRAEVHKTLSLLATEGGTDAKMLLSDAHEFIDALPSADAVQGEWIDVENEPYCECSVCGSYIDNLDDDYAFCPRCGARMKGGAE